MNNIISLVILLKWSIFSSYSNLVHSFEFYQWMCNFLETLSNFSCLQRTQNIVLSRRWFCLDDDVICPFLCYISVLAFPLAFGWLKQCPTAYVVLSVLSSHFTISWWKLWYDIMQAHVSKNWLHYCFLKKDLTEHNTL